MWNKKKCTDCSCNDKCMCWSDWAWCAWEWCSCWVENNSVSANSHAIWDVQTSIEQPDRSPQDVKMINDIFGDIDMDTGEDVWWQDDLTDEQITRLQWIFKK